MPPPPIAIVIMGVSGAGKTTVGSALAAALGWRFIDADAYHSLSNVAKMRQGTGLDDADRWPWLESVRDAITAAGNAGESVVVACSALKEAYRNVLDSAGVDVRYVHLQADERLLRERLAGRTGHFAGAQLLATQTRDLEPPGGGALTLDASKPPGVLVDAVRQALRL